MERRRALLAGLHDQLDRGCPRRHHRVPPGCPRLPGDARALGQLRFHGPAACAAVGAAEHRCLRWRPRPRHSLRSVCRRHERRAAHGGAQLQGPLSRDVAGEQPARHPLPHACASPAARRAASRPGQLQRDGQRMPARRELADDCRGAAEVSGAVHPAHHDGLLPLLSCDRRRPHPGPAGGAAEARRLRQEPRLLSVGHLQERDPALPAGHLSACAALQGTGRPHLLRRRARRARAVPRHPACGQPEPALHHVDGLALLLRYPRRHPRLRQRRHALIPLPVPPPPLERPHQHTVRSVRRCCLPQRRNSVRVPQRRLCGQREHDERRGGAVVVVRGLLDERRPGQLCGGLLGPCVAALQRGGGREPRLQPPKRAHDAGLPRREVRLLGLAWLRQLGSSAASPDPAASRMYVVG
mmetsp:Transcript_1585/g.5591  ORF Transcript_1585/g.5591 Transcript_1585/m.5591 type:complete len:412 (-) Transcript_1585:1772-3007(-)